MFAWLWRRKEIRHKQNALETLNETMTRLSSSTSYLRHRRREMICKRRETRIRPEHIAKLDRLINAQEDRMHQLDAIILSTHAISIWTESTAAAMQTMVSTLRTNTTENIIESMQDGLDMVDEYVQMTDLNPMDDSEFDALYAEFLEDTVDANEDPYLGLALPTAPQGNLDDRANRPADRSGVVAGSGRRNRILQA